MNNLLIKNLEKAEIISIPYNHSLLKLFTQETNDILIENFYQIIDNFKNLNGLSSSRFMIHLYGDLNNGIDFNKYLFLKNIQPLYSILLEYQNIVIKTLINKYKLKKNKNYKYCIMLVYDKKNYEIGPHTDSFLEQLHKLHILFIKMI